MGLTNYWVLHERKQDFRKWLLRQAQFTAQQPAEIRIKT